MPLRRGFLNGTSGSGKKKSRSEVPAKDEDLQPRVESTGDVPGGTTTVGTSSSDNSAPPSAAAADAMCASAVGLFEFLNGKGLAYEELMAIAKGKGKGKDDGGFWAMQCDNAQQALHLEMFRNFSTDELAKFLEFIKKEMASMP